MRSSLFRYSFRFKRSLSSGRFSDKTFLLSELEKRGMKEETERNQWVSEMKEWNEETIQSFMDKLSKIQGDKQEIVVEEKVVKEFGGPKGPEPTRYGDWSVKGRVSDF